MPAHTQRPYQQEREQQGAINCRDRCCGVPALTAPARAAAPAHRCKAPWDPCRAATACCCCSAARLSDCCRMLLTAAASQACWRCWTAPQGVRRTRMRFSSSRSHNAHGSSTNGSNNHGHSTKGGTNSNGSSGSLLSSSGKDQTRSNNSILESSSSKVLCRMEPSGPQTVGLQTVWRHRQQAAPTMQQIYHRTRPCHQHSRLQLLQQALVRLQVRLPGSQCWEKQGPGPQACLGATAPGAAASAHLLAATARRTPQGSSSFRVRACLARGLLHSQV